MSKHKLRAWLPVNCDDDEIEVEITFTFLRGAPERGPSYASGGQPADPDEIELVSAVPVRDGKYYSAGTHHLVWLEDAAGYWLDSDGRAEAYATVRDDDEAAREYAAELRADR